MRKVSHNPRLQFIRYGIREIMELVQRLSELDAGFRFVGENIGDPIAKGWSIPVFVKEILRDLIFSDNGDVFGYAHSRGRVEAREWVARQANELVPGISLSCEDVAFFNGLGSVISSFYRVLEPGMRVIQPVPGYPAHMSAERFASGSESITYELDPNNSWQPDLDHLRHQVEKHPEAAGILLINPNNPTGAVYGSEILEEIVRIAERHQLILISDEIYFRLVFNGAEYKHVTGIANGRVPLVVMRGISKDIPWPGARCGWIEFHNCDVYDGFRSLLDGVRKLLTVEVSATNLPQAAMPLIYDHPDYSGWLEQYNSKIQENSNIIADLLDQTPGITAHRIQGAFYMSVLFEDGVLNGNQSLPITRPAARDLIERMVDNPGLPLDKRFAYFLLAATGICVVPTSDFEYTRPGFRVTTLERDSAQLVSCYKTMSESVVRYLASG